MPGEGNPAARPPPAAGAGAGSKWGEWLENPANFPACQRFAGSHPPRWKDGAGGGGGERTPSLGFNNCSGHFGFPAPRGLFFFPSVGKSWKEGFARRSGTNGPGACPQPGPGACPLAAGGRGSAGRSLLPSPIPVVIPLLNFSVPKSSSEEKARCVGGDSARRCVGLYPHGRLFAGGKIYLFLMGGSAE